MSTPTPTETLIWEGHPSQWSNFPVYVLCLLLSPLVIPLFVLLWKWLDLKLTTYRITTERIVSATGILNKRTEEIELYRVKDSTLLQPFWLRLVGCGHVILSTSDKTTPIVRLEAIKDPNELREKLRAAVEQLRTRKGIREVDVE
jgi:uncharacterized membrane protein YdbT with pleckstrin-like domain